MIKIYEVCFNEDERVTDSFWLCPDAAREHVNSLLRPVDYMILDWELADSEGKEVVNVRSLS